MRYSQVFSLTATVRSHSCKTVSSASRTGIHREAKAGISTFTIFAMTTANIKRQAYHITNFNISYSFTYLFYLTQIFVTQYSYFFHISSSFIHVKVRTADISARDLHQHIGELFDFSVRHIHHPHIEGA